MKYLSKTSHRSNIELLDENYGCNRKNARLVNVIIMQNNATNEIEPS